MQFKNQKAIYRQIADYLLDNILARRLQAGDRVQSVRELAKEVQVNPNTVMRTFTFLNEEGIIVNQRGIGYFITDNALQKTQALKKADFVKEQLPELFKTMQLLNINFEELQHFYHQFNPIQHEIK
ncbi:MAG: GntR family transcriptional regulator [Bacteroidota bacterium]